MWDSARERAWGQAATQSWGAREATHSVARWDCRPVLQKCPMAGGGGLRAGGEWQGCWEIIPETSPWKSWKTETKGERCGLAPGCSLYSCQLPTGSPERTSSLLWSPNHEILFHTVTTQKKPAEDRPRVPVLTLAQCLTLPGTWVCVGMCGALPGTPA